MQIKLKKYYLVSILCILALAYFSFWHWKSLQIDYSNLEKLLIKKQWIEADIETSKIMNQLLYKATDDRTFFGFSRIPYIPMSHFLRISHAQERSKGLSCSHLQAIDELWYKYSNGKFGFRIQQKIASSIPGYKDENFSTVGKTFAKQVNWDLDFQNKPSLTNQDWYSPIQNSKMPNGFLPSISWVYAIQAKYVGSRTVIATLKYFKNCSV